MPEPEAIELLTRVLCDVPPAGGLDGAYLFAQTPDNQASVFEAACHLVRETADVKILILKAAAQSGYPGFNTWHWALAERGIPGSRIEGVDVEEVPALNTRIEAEALVRFARRKGYRSLLIVAPPFHQLRAFMTAVTVAVEEEADLRLYSGPGAVLPWHEPVAHSQGTLTGARKDLIGHELEKIARYQAQGDLASFERVLHYLDGRDGAV